jgi:hypothetical protein
MFTSLAFCLKVYIKVSDLGITLKYMQRRGQDTTFAILGVAEAHVTNPRISTILSNHISKETIFSKDNPVFGRWFLSIFLMGMH